MSSETAAMGEAADSGLFSIAEAALSLSLPQAFAFAAASAFLAVVLANLLWPSRYPTVKGPKYAQCLHLAHRPPLGILAIPACLPDFTSSRLICIYVVLSAGSAESTTCGPSRNLVLLDVLFRVIVLLLDFCTACSTLC